MPRFLDHFRLVAPHYDRIFRFQDDGRLTSILQPTPAGWTLDAGGGTGRVAQTLQGVSDRIVVLDESEGMLRQARMKGLHAVLGEIERLPFRREAFARILMVDTFHHLRDQRTAVGELVRTLAQKGRLVMQEPDIRDGRVKLTALGEKLLLMRSRFRRPITVQRMFSSNGAQVQIHRERDRAHFWAVVEKDG